MLLQIRPGDVRNPADIREAHAFHGAVSPHEKLLLLGILLIVAAWIGFRVAMLLLATLG